MFCGLKNTAIEDKGELVRSTKPEKPLVLVTVTVALDEEPGRTVGVSGPAATIKPGGGFTRIAITTARVTSPLVPVTVTLYGPGGTVLTVDTVKVE